MLPNPKNYSVWPSVVEAGKPTLMTVTANERAFYFNEGETVDFTVIPVNGDELSYHTPTTHIKFSAEAHGGAVAFTHSFDKEQEYLIIMYRGEKKLIELSVYAVESDLFALTPLKGDLHSHSYRSDGRRDPVAWLGHYREQGYDFAALTDHNRYYPGGEMDEAYDGVRLAIKRVRGEEVHTPGSIIHIVHIGGGSSVTDIYYKQPKDYEAGVNQCLSRVPNSVPEQYKERYARAMWATESIHKAGGLAVFAHPYWRPGGSKVYNVCDELTEIMLKSGMFDAFELIGGQGYDGVNRAVVMWAKLKGEGINIPVVGSSDVHGMQSDYTYPYFYTVCFATENSNDGVMAAVKAGKSVAVQQIGDDKSRNCYCYGDLRYVSYAQFLLKNYFPALQRVCQGEGVAMRLYAIGEGSRAAIEAQVENTEGFTGRYFGKKPPVLPTKEMLEFERRWREVQLGTPPTCGSAIVSDKVTRQI